LKSGQEDLESTGGDPRHRKRDSDVGGPHDAAVLVLFTAASVPAAQFGTAEEAKAMLEKAAGAVKEDKAKALDMFNKGEGGFKDRDLYVFCANASDGVLTAHPYLKGEHLQDIKGKKGFPLGQEIMRKERSARSPIFGLAPVQTNRLRSTLFSRGSAIRTAGSAVTRNKRRFLTSR
jgi:hypothetical protein